MSIEEEIKESRQYSKMVPLQIPNGQVLNHHLYTRFIGKKTELWFFGCGLGDQAVISQIGETFLELCEEGMDPELGRVMISFGNGPTAMMSYKGDINVRWSLGSTGYEDWFKSYIKHAKVKPDLYLCASQKVLDRINEEGLHGILLPQGVGKQFKPLNLEREGLGYAGLNTKTKEMTHIMLGPAIERGLEWVSKDPSSGFKSLPELNEWYNEKQIIFGMDWPENKELGVVTNRVYESIASGTPFIQYRLQTLSKTLGFEYPYQSSTYEETDQLIDEILSDYDAVLEQFGIWSWAIRSQHSYRNRLEDILLPALQEIAK